MIPEMRAYASFFDDLTSYRRLCSAIGGLFFCSPFLLELFKAIPCLLWLIDYLLWITVFFFEKIGKFH